MDSSFSSLPTELHFEIALKTDYKTLIHLCSTSKRLRERIYESNVFLEAKNGM